MIAMKNALKYFVLLAIGGILYACCEMIFRGYTFKTMAVAGGICFVMCGLINEILSWKTPLAAQMLICAVIVTAVEFVAGLVLNVWLDLGMWDYSQLPLNVCGQICPQFFLVWFALALPAITLDDFLRWKLFGEEKPKYYLTFGKDNFECGHMGRNGICKRHVESCENRLCKARNQCGECKNYMIPKTQQPCKGCKHIRG